MYNRRRDRTTSLFLPRARRLIRFAFFFALTATLACPIQRPPVPPEYYDFRSDLQTAVRDTAIVEMEGLSRMQSRLEVHLTDLSAITRVDSLLTALEADSELYPLSGAIATTVRIRLESKHVGGGVRQAFLNPDGQRLAVDAIIIGLGRALYLLRSSSSGLAVFAEIRNSAADPVASLQGLSDANGEAQLSWRISRRREPGSYTVSVLSVLNGDCIYDPATGPLAAITVQ